VTGKTTTISVLPGPDEALLAPSGIYDASTADFTATAAGSQAQALQLTPKLSAASVAGIAQAVKAAMVGCATAPDYTCPNINSGT
jgi:hypothetical protein